MCRVCYGTPERVASSCVSRGRGGAVYPDGARRSFDLVRRCSRTDGARVRGERSSPLHASSRSSSDATHVTRMTRVVPLLIRRLGVLTNERTNKRTNERRRRPNVARRSSTSSRTRPRRPRPRSRARASARRRRSAARAAVAATATMTVATSQSRFVMAYRIRISFLNHSRVTVTSRSRRSASVRRRRGSRPRASTARSR